MVRRTKDHFVIDVSIFHFSRFWEVMEEFTNQERSLFLRFVWGRTRLPRNIADFRGRDFVLQGEISAYYLCDICYIMIN